MKQMTADFDGMFVNMRHFAVSGKTDRKVKIYQVGVSI